MEDQPHKDCETWPDMVIDQNLSCYVGWTSVTSSYFFGCSTGDFMAFDPANSDLAGTRRSGKDCCSSPSSSTAHRPVLASPNLQFLQAALAGAMTCQGTAFCLWMEHDGTPPTSIWSKSCIHAAVGCCWDALKKAVPVASQERAKSGLWVVFVISYQRHSFRP